MTIFPQLETDLMDAHQRLTARRRSRAMGWLISHRLATRSSVLLAGATLGLGGATALAASAGVPPFAPSGPSITGTAVAHPPGPPPAVDGVPIDPTTGALPPGALGSGPAKQGTIASTPSGPPPAVNGVPIDPTTGAVGHRTSNTIRSGAPVNHPGR
jgi:hypothetical protein